MSVYVTGDCHGDFRKFSTDSFPEQKQKTRDDYVIVCGDFGIWNGDDGERWWLKWLSEKPFTTLFVDGNHENFDRIYGGSDYPPEFETVDLLGGKAQKIRDGIYHLMRGEIYTIEGKKFFAFGGARSHDIQDGILDRADFDNNLAFRNAIREWSLSGKSFRINHLSWWEQELPSIDEYHHGENTLRANAYKVDYIVSHCAPARVASHFGFRDVDPLTIWFNDVDEAVSFKQWFFGHYHHNNSFGPYIMLYDQIVRIL